MADFDSKNFETLIFRQKDDRRRFTQDSPVLPDVWLSYFTDQENKRVDLLLTPHRQSTAAELLKSLRNGLNSYLSNEREATEDPWQLANSGDAVAANLTFDELILVALPMTQWWRKYLWDARGEPMPEMSWLMDIAGAVVWSRSHEGYKSDELTEANILEIQSEGVFQSAFEEHFPALERKPKSPICLWSVSLNRGIKLSLAKSVPTTKADAGRRLFDIDGSGICWAILDSGIDARHPAFRKVDSKGEPHQEPMEGRGARQPNHTRIVATFDFTKFRALMSNLSSQSAANKDTKQNFEKKLFTEILGPTANSEDKPLSDKEKEDLARDLERAVRNGRTLDWSAISPLLRIPHTQEDYRPPGHPHGTHVAGILGADMRPWEGTREDALIGMCPGIAIYDLRVMGDDGTGDEFGILAALQFVRWLNKQQDQLIIHGVNLSLSLPHAVVNFACGRTPVCEECQRLVAEGTVVVAAAGNRGQAVYTTRSGPEEGFRTLSITDPGNAEAVITVGSTHRDKPHTYGVSYFSSRGPTGDGRAKPDLLAPGEKILSTVLNGKSERMDGTSMAAPHVSGAAALLLARHRELIGEPARVKETLCKSAVDLGRERYFQGYGLVDVLRALQSL